MDDGSGQSLDTLSFNNSSQQHRRRLVKKPPPSSYRHASSTSFDGHTIDFQSLQSKHSSTSLRRAPSAPQSRPSFPPYAPSSTSSSPLHQPSAGSPSLSKLSPNLPGTEFLTNDYQQYQQQVQAQKKQLQTRGQLLSPYNPPQHPKQHNASLAAASASPNRMDYSDSDSVVRTHSHGSALTSPSEEFVGAPFDGDAIFNRIDGKVSPLLPTQQPPLPPTSHPRPRSPQATVSNMQPAASAASASAGTPSSSANVAATTTTNVASAPVTAVASPTPSNELSEKTPSAPQVVNDGPAGSTSGSDSQHVGAKRYSDDNKEFRAPGMLRKKSGFSGFMTSLVGSPKKPLISAPENPVHVTHVGYDSNTGQFTVRPTIMVVVTFYLQT